jgi:hypothetical protein
MSWLNKDSDGVWAIVGVIIAVGIIIMVLHLLG